MTFTYTEDLTLARDFVRFHTGDTVEAHSFLSDAIIDSLLATEPSREAAVLAALRYIIARLSQPDFRADWLQVDHASARAGYECTLAMLAAQFGLDALAVDGVATTRADT